MPPCFMVLLEIPLPGDDPASVFFSKISRAAAVHPAIGKPARGAGGAGVDGKVLKKIMAVAFLRERFEDFIKILLVLGREARVVKIAAEKFSQRGAARGEIAGAFDVSG